jgi:hypothetical protein
MDVSGELHAPAALPPEKERLVSTGWEPVWAPEPGWTLWKKEHQVSVTVSIHDSICVCNTGTGDSSEFNFGFEVFRQGL